MTDGISADLTGEIDLDGGVDGGDAVVSSDGGGVVGVVGAVKLDEGVIVNEIEESAGAVCGSGPERCR